MNEYLQITTSSYSLIKSLLMVRKGKVIFTTLSGIVDCTSRLSLTPDVTLAISPPGVITTPSFHPCVRLSRWAKSPGTISFVPPDGPFTLLDYETPDIHNVDIPLRTEAKLENTGEFEIRLTPGGKKIEELTVIIPLNTSITGTTNTRPSRGDFTTTSKTLTWTVPNDKTSAGMLGAGRPGYVLKGQFTGEENMVLPSDVVVKFSCQGWLASGITVGGLRVTGTGVADGMGSTRGGVYKGVKGITNVEVIVRL
jgi:AP-3 complex subunit mu